MKYSASGFSDIAKLLCSVQLVGWVLTSWARYVQTGSQHKLLSKTGLYGSKAEAKPLIGHQNVLILLSRKVLLIMCNVLYYQHQIRNIMISSAHPWDTPYEIFLLISAFYDKFGY